MTRGMLLTNVVEAADGARRVSIETEVVGVRVPSWAP
jgi:hypothetical protein